MHARTDSRVFRFGPFELDPDQRRLTNGTERIRLRDRQMDVLLLLLAHHGQVVLKEHIIHHAWHGVAVTDNSIVQAVKGLREALGTQADGTPFIETLPKEGYRFAATVENVERVAATESMRGASGSAANAASAPAVNIETMLEPFDAFLHGRLALEAMDRDSLRRASEAFTQSLRLETTVPNVHAALAMATTLDFESNRGDAEPDRATLAQGELHARRACELEPKAPESWGSLAAVLYRRAAAFRDGPGRLMAVAAARKAIALDPEGWRFHVLLANVSWGGERLRAANRALQLGAPTALPHWLAATVFVAREAFDAALDHLRAGCEMQDKQGPTSRYPAVGLHLLHGLVITRTGRTGRTGGAGRAGRAGEKSTDLDNAFAEFERELTFEKTRHIHVNESIANTYYSIGALHVRTGNKEDALRAFEQARLRMPGHPLATIAATALGRRPTAQPHYTNIDDVIERAMAQAVTFALDEQHESAAAVCGQAFAQAGVGAEGWILPVEPLLDVGAHRDVWAGTLAALHNRAS
jgi:DNA-binding winged helix-turn-helix (wHTH) protein